MMHRKNSHPATVAYCRKLSEGTCNYTVDSCWWNHTQKENIATKNQCYICSQTFNSKPELMSHRKNNHTNIVPQCTQFLRGVCKFQSKFCWYSHENEEVMEEISNDEEKEEEVDESPSVFQEDVDNPDPPSGLPNRKEDAQS